MYENVYLTNSILDSRLETLVMSSCDEYGFEPLPFHKVGETLPQSVYEMTECI